MELQHQTVKQLELLNCINFSTLCSFTTHIINMKSLTRCIFNRQRKPVTSVSCSHSSNIYNFSIATCKYHMLTKMSTRTWRWIPKGQFPLRACHARGTYVSCGACVRCVNARIKHTCCCERERSHCVRCRCVPLTSDALHDAKKTKKVFVRFFHAANARVRRM